MPRAGAQRVIAVDMETMPYIWRVWKPSPGRARQVGVLMDPSASAPSKYAGRGMLGFRWAD